MKSILVMMMALMFAAAPSLVQGQGQGKGKGMGKGMGMHRAWLEKSYRAHGEQLVRKRLNLNNQQLQKLRQVNGHFIDRRRSLVQQQRNVQLELRNELARGGAANQAHVAQLNGQLNALVRQRFELQQQERGELSKFLTPVQQAQYEGLQAQLRQRVQNLQGQPGQPLPQGPGPFVP